MKSFLGKSVLITGANGGVGRALIQSFAAEGATVIAHARKENDEFSAFIKNVSSKYDVKIQPIYFDLLDFDKVSSELKKAVRDLRKLDVLINNAGMVGSNKMFFMTTLSDMREMFEVNFFSAMLITQIVGRVMTKNKSGVIINVSSVAALDGDPGQLEYSCSKAALACATKKLAIDLGGFGVRVNTVAPALTDTRMLNNMEPDVEKKAISRSILGRKSTPDEIASVITFLSSEKAKFITGQTIRVDGGVRVMAGG